MKHIHLQTASNLFIAIAIFGAPCLANASSVAGTIYSSGQANYTDFGSIFTDGEGGSLDIPGIEYDLFFANTLDQAVSTVSAYNVTLSTTYATLYETSDAGAAQEFILKSAGGEKFKLTSFTLLDFEGVNASWTVSAFVNGSSLGSQYFTVPQTDDYFTTVNLDAIFQNIDEVKITASDGLSGGNIYGGFNSFVIDDPVAIPEPATLALAVSGAALLASFRKRRKQR